MTIYDQLLHTDSLSSDIVSQEMAGAMRLSCLITVLVAVYFIMNAKKQESALSNYNEISFSDVVAWLTKCQPMTFNPMLEDAVSTFEHSTNGFGFAPNVAVWFTKWQQMQLTKWYDLLMIFNSTLEHVISAIECSSGHANTYDESDNMRGPNKPPKKDTVPLHQSSCILHKSSVESTRNYGPLANDNCNRDSFHAAGSAAVSQTSVLPTRPVGLFRNPNNFAGDECESDKLHGATISTIRKTDHHNADLLQNNLVGSNNYHATSNQTLGKHSLHTTYSRTATMHSASTSQPLKGTPLIARDRIMETPALTQSKPQTALENSSIVTSGSHGCYLKSSYPVLVGNTVRTYNTKLYASLPQQNKYMVKQRVQDASGATKIKLVLLSSNESSMKEPVYSLPQAHVPGDDDDDDVETDGNNKKTHYRGNTKKAGYIAYTCDGRFRGDIKYPLPNGKATNSKIGKGGNGFVFIIYHGKKQYAVKQTVYRPNEVNVHSSLSHVNILPLLAVLMGEKHETHAGRSYCYHFMPKMDYDLRQILSTKEVGCLKYLYRNCSTNRARFDRAFSNVKFILKETLKALSYIHSNGYVHRDVKASNIMIRMNCQCNPLYCDCSSKFKVKLGDYDSAGTIPGLGIKEPTDQMIKFASILPLGTPGYRAPEVSMHIVLSGPYETLYNTAVDMWSFGCLCLNICIGKTAAVKQREEALLLLSTTNQCYEELWTKTTKIHELERTQPFSNDTMLLHLIRSCLRVNYKRRLSATDAQAYL